MASLTLTSRQVALDVARTDLRCSTMDSVSSKVVATCCSTDGCSRVCGVTLCSAGVTGLLYVHVYGHVHALPLGVSSSVRPLVCGGME